MTKLYSTVANIALPENVTRDAFFDTIQQRLNLWCGTRVSYTETTCRIARFTSRVHVMVPFKTDQTFLLPVLIWGEDRGHIETVAEEVLRDFDDRFCRLPVTSLKDGLRGMVTHWVGRDQMLAASAAHDIYLEYGFGVTHNKNAYFTKLVNLEKFANDVECRVAVRKEFKEINTSTLFANRKLREGLDSSIVVGFKFVDNVDEDSTVLLMRDGKPVTVWVSPTGMMVSEFNGRDHISLEGFDDTDPRIQLCNVMNALSLDSGYKLRVIRGAQPVMTTDIDRFQFC